jgi:hypothetical protein
MSKISPEQNKEIADCINLFKHVNDGVSVLFGRPVERKSADTLLKKFSLPSHSDPTKTQLQALIDLLPRYNADCKKKYEIVLKPSKLLEQIENVKAWKRKVDNEDHNRLKQELLLKQEQEEQEKRRRLLETVPLSERQEKFNSIRNIIKNA